MYVSSYNVLSLSMILMFCSAVMFPETVNWIESADEWVSSNVFCVVLALTSYRKDYPYRYQGTNIDTTVEDLVRNLECYVGNLAIEYHVYICVLFVVVVLPYLYSMLWPSYSLLEEEGSPSHTVIAVPFFRQSTVFHASLRCWGQWDKWLWWPQFWENTLRLFVISIR